MKRIATLVLVFLLSVSVTPSFAGAQKSVKYRRSLRDLDKVYNSGGLTRTQYIQRKREIKALYGKGSQKQKAKPRACEVII